MSSTARTRARAAGPAGCRIVECWIPLHPSRRCKTSSGTVLVPLFPRCCNGGHSLLTQRCILHSLAPFPTGIMLTCPVQLNGYCCPMCHLTYILCFYSIQDQTLFNCLICSCNACTCMVPVGLPRSYDNVLNVLSVSLKQSDVVHGFRLYHQVLHSCSLVVCTICNLMFITKLTIHQYRIHGNISKHQQFLPFSKR